MHLSRGYAWNLRLSKRELETVIQALNIVVKENDLAENEHTVAKRILKNIVTIRDRAEFPREGPQAEEELHESVAKEV